MKKHSGMRPQDIAVLLKIVAKGKSQWYAKDLAYELHLSSSEVSESLNRSRIAGLINAEKKNIHRLSLMDFIRYGLQYVFPAIPGPIVNGMPTAHSHPVLKKHFLSADAFVWQEISGQQRGQSIEPLYKGAVNASKLDPLFYLLLSLADTIRVGQSREKK